MILIQVLCNRHYYWPHFTNDRTEVSLSNLPKIILLTNRNIRPHDSATKFMLFTTLPQLHLSRSCYSYVYISWPGKQLNGFLCWFSSRRTVSIPPMHAGNGETSSLPRTQGSQVHPHGAMRVESGLVLMLLEPLFPLSSPSHSSERLWKHCKN